MKDITKGEIFGWMVWVVALGALAMIGIYVLMWIADPVAQKVGETIGNASRALHIGRGNDFHSLAVLCIIIIGVIGLVKVITRKR
jgi:hypothetical protein